MILRPLYRLRFRNLRNILTGACNLTLQSKMNIGCFVFFDIETTGLPYQEYNKTRITETCFVAVESEHIALGVYPRVQNKLTLCFNPQKFIDPEATRLTRLSNELLEFQSTFNSNICQVINKFLELQKKPICLVAHNGNRFDYPILKAELHKVGAELFDNIVCIDTLEMFRDIDKRKVMTPEQTNVTEDETSELSIYDLPTQKSVPVELCDGFDELLFHAVDSIENTSNIVKQAQNMNENTPKKLINTTKKRKQFENPLQDHLYYTPSTSKENKNTDISGSIFPSANITESQAPRAKKKLEFGKPSYKLIDIYKRLTNKENENAHLADQDVNMLIECAATMGQSFVNWANANAKKFSNIPMMTPGVKF